MNDPIKTALGWRLHRPWTSCKAADCGGNLSQVHAENRCLIRSANRTISCSKHTFLRNGLHGCWFSNQGIH